MDNVSWVLVGGVVVGTVAALMLAFGLAYLTSKAEQEEDERLRYELARRNAQKGNE